MHSTAHLLAQAIKEIFPNAKIAIGPALKETFYYDIDVDEVINEDVLSAIEDKMKEIAKRSYRVSRVDMDYDEAINLFKKMKEDYKVEIIEEIESDDKISAYRQGDFLAICRGRHVPKSKIQLFNLFPYQKIIK